MKVFSNFRKELQKKASRKIRQPRPPALLKAASFFYEKGVRKDQARLLRKRAKLPATVISIGNLSVGGTGKTPLTIWMCRFLLEIGRHPAVLTRGYGGRGTGPIPASGSRALAELFGDEPVMMSRYLPSTPVWVGSDRTASGQAALAAGGVDVLVLDDGFQHLALARDLDIVLLDCRNPLGNGFVLPAGPLREPASSLKRADLFVLTHAGGPQVDSEALSKKLKALFPDIPAFACSHRFIGVRLGDGGALIPPDGLRGQKAVAFAGIAFPESFFEDLRKAGLELCQSFDFPDHHRYRPEDLLQILSSASGHRAALILTTAKDAARLPSFLKNLFAVTEIGIDFGPDHADFRRFIADRLPLATR